MNKFRSKNILIMSLMILGLAVAGLIQSDTSEAASESLKIEVSFDGLENLGEGFVYEGWVIENGSPVSAGRFTVDDEGVASSTEFTAEVGSAADVSTYVLTIEPEPDTDPAPTATHVVAGDFSEGSAALTIGHPAALGDDFTTAAGSYILAVPSDTNNVAAYNNGIWFLDPSGPTATLDLAELPDGWAYEGWIVTADGPISTGTFTDVAAADRDEGGPDAGPGDTPGYPGQDFVDPALDLIGTTAVISIEPSPDNSPAPFRLKPLVDTVEDTGTGGVLQALTNNIANSNITGTASFIVTEEAIVQWTLRGLEDLGEDYVYEGWLIDNGSAISAGRFSVDAAGVPSISTFSAQVSAIENVSTFVLTIEPAVGDDPAPAATHILAGDFDGATASITLDHGAALGTAFTDAAGSYILAVPSDTDGVAAYNNGIWYLDPAGPTATLELPELPAGWAYEGWIVGEDGPISTGTFTDVAAADSDAGGPTAGPGATPGYPGQDFVDPAVNLVGTTAVISVEPSPDNSPAPFTLKPLVDLVEDTGAPGILQEMTNNAANTPIFGTVSIGPREEIAVWWDFAGLEDLGADYVYEGWVIDNGAPVSTGRFTVDADGNLSSKVFRALVTDLDNVSTYVLTIEPAVGDDPAPAATHLLAGNFNTVGVAQATIGHAAALGDDFTSAAGSFILAVPSDTDGVAAYNNGIWYLDPAGPSATLDLPVLPEGWAYEGWVVTADGPISTGTFTDVAAADSDAGGPTAGPGATPGYPGQDFVDPAIDLIGAKAVISIEPVPDNDPAPFTLKPLFTTITDPGGPGILQDINNYIGETEISGTVKIGDLQTIKVDVELEGLEDLGEDYVYEGWVIDNGQAISAGRFSATGGRSVATTVSIEAWVTDISNVSTYVLTIEPAVGDDPAPSATHVVAGDIVDGEATLSIGHGAALGDDFTNAAGSYILAVPSDTDGVAAYNNGIWFLDPAGPTPTLDLPTLPAGWVYEGWVVTADGPISTGTFTDVAAADSDAGGPTAGPGGTPGYPGQDFVNPAIDLIGTTAVISIEPSPDNSPAPFTFKPLVDVVEDTGGPGILQEMTNNIENSSISGTVTVAEKRVYLFPTLIR